MNMRLTSAAALFAAAFIAAGCATTENTTDAPSSPAAATTPIDAASVTLYVSGLGCPLCASNIEDTVRKLPGVSSITVALDEGRVDVALLAAGRRPSASDFENAVEDAGFTLDRLETH